MSAERTALYRCFDVDEELLYVGISKDPKARWAQHRKSSPWWSDVTVRTVEWFDSREAAANAERTAIQTEGPQHNDRLNPTTHRNVIPPGVGHRTLADLYADRDLAPEQARRIAATFARAEGRRQGFSLPPSDETPDQPIC